MQTQRTDISDRPSPEDAASLIDRLMTDFAEGRLDAVWIVYSQFRSAMSTPPSAKRILPVQGVTGGEEGEAGATARAASYILSPSGDEILNQLLPLYVRSSVFRALVETAAAEQGARRTAMKNATDNAGDMLDDLNRTFNRARQGQITQELAEIVGGAAALE